MNCIRCGRNERLEEHHIIDRSHGGGEEPENKEWRCSACHDYEHARRNLVAALEYEKKREQVDRIRVYQHRLEVLDKLNTPEIIREKGKYTSYWSDNSTHRLPRRIPTHEEAELEQQLKFCLSEAMAEGGEEDIGGNTETQTRGKAREGLSPRVGEVKM